jgi:predicted 3-demethylubiquinone-9 3-methyltransferase (glyoxalase superfamily)
MSAIVPCLVFQDRAAEAVAFYTSAFPRSRVVSIVRAPAGGPLPEGAVLHARFELDGRAYTAFDGGPHFAFSQAFSLVATCATQAELDDVWAKLCADGGKAGPCGWVTDKFGVSWQVVPAALGEMMSAPERGDTAAVMAALMKMGKLDVAALQRAYGA